MDDYNELINELKILIYILCCETFIFSPVLVLVTRYVIKKVHYRNIPDTISSPPNLDENVEKIINNLTNEEIIECINSFENILKEKLPHVSLSAFYRNLQTLTIKYKNLNTPEISFTNYSIGGGYDIEKNILYNNSLELSNKDILIFYHEMLHMASCIKDNNTYYTGFEITDNTNKFISKLIGKGLNEGYTELLISRYFGERKTNTYLHGKHIAKHLEIIIGQQEMEMLYFKSDLYGLIKKLEEYIDEESIINFLKSLDFINSYILLTRTYKFNKKGKEFLKSKFFIATFLINLYISKNKLIDDESLTKGINSYLSTLFDFGTTYMDSITNYKDGITIDDVISIYTKKLN